MPHQRRRQNHLRRRGRAVRRGHHPLPANGPHRLRGERRTRRRPHREWHQRRGLSRCGPRLGRVRSDLRGRWPDGRARGDRRRWRALPQRRRHHRRAAGLPLHPAVPGRSERRHTVRHDRPDQRRAPPRGERDRRRRQRRDGARSRDRRRQPDAPSPEIPRVCPTGIAASGQGAGQIPVLTAGWKGHKGARLRARYGPAHDIEGTLTDGASTSGSPARPRRAEQAAGRASGQRASGRGRAGGRSPTLSWKSASCPRYRGASAIRLAAPHTSANGHWSLALPRDLPSATLRIGYRQNPAEAQPAALQTLTLTVPAALRLHISPRTAPSGGAIHFSGRLRGGPIPPGGKQLVLEARSPGGALDRVPRDPHPRGRALRLPLPLPPPRPRPLPVPRALRSGGRLPVRRRGFERGGGIRAVATSARMLALRLLSHLKLVGPRSFPCDTYFPLGGGTAG